MIGGTDIYIEIASGAPAIDFVVFAIRLFWPHAVFENANSDDPAAQYERLDFSSLTEVMAYKDDKAAAAWEKLGADPSLDGTMIHLMLSPSHLAIIVDDHPSAEIKSIVGTISQGLKKSRRIIDLRVAA